MYVCVLSVWTSAELIFRAAEEVGRWEKSFAYFFMALYHFECSDKNQGIVTDF